MKQQVNNQEREWERHLKIWTSGRDDSKADTYRYPYEPTPYNVLERLGNSGLIGKKNTLIDYGCGKGRVGFFLSYQTRCRSLGIEYDERLYQKAVENQKEAISGQRVRFLCENAQDHVLSETVDRCYFFNPFSVEILQSVMERIIESYYSNPREILLFFYYPSDEYIAYLMTVDWLNFYDEIDCEDLFEGGKEREKILIFCVGVRYTEFTSLECYIQCE